MCGSQLGVCLYRVTVRAVLDWPPLIGYVQGSSLEFLEGINVWVLCFVKLK